MLCIKPFAFRKRQVRDIQREIRALTVFTLHITRHKITDKLRPALLGIAGADRIGVLQRLLRQQCDMRPAEHDGDIFRPHLRRQFIGTRRIAGDHRHCDQICREIRRQFLNAFINQADINRQGFRHQCGKGGQRQRLITQRAFENSAPFAVQRPFRRKQHQIQRPLRRIISLCHHGNSLISNMARQSDEVSNAGILISPSRFPRCSCR